MGYFIKITKGGGGGKQMDGRAHTTFCAHLRFVQYCFKCLTHDLQASMRVNVTSERIPTHPGIKVKSDRAYEKRMHTFTDFISIEIISWLSIFLQKL